MNDRPIYGITVLRYADGRTEVKGQNYMAVRDENTGGYQMIRVDMPEAWEERHALLIDGCGEVKRDAGVVHSGLEGA